MSEQSDFENDDFENENQAEQSLVQLENEEETYSDLDIDPEAPSTEGDVQHHLEQIELGLRAEYDAEVKILSDDYQADRVALHALYKQKFKALAILHGTPDPYPSEDQSVQQTAPRKKSAQGRKTRRQEISQQITRPTTRKETQPASSETDPVILPGPGADPQERPTGTDKATETDPVLGYLKTYGSVTTAGLLTRALNAADNGLAADKGKVKLALDRLTRSKEVAKYIHEDMETGSKIAWYQLATAKQPIKGAVLAKIAEMEMKGRTTTATAPKRRRKRRVSR